MLWYSALPTCVRQSIQVGSVDIPGTQVDFSDALGLFVSRHGRIHDLAPGVDASRHVLNLCKSLLAKELRHAEASPAMMAMDDNPTTRLKFDCATRYLPHRYVR